MNSIRQSDNAEGPKAADVRTEDVDAIVTSHGTEKHQLIPILHSIQDKYRYLPREALRRICEITDITPSQVNGVSTFFKQYRHQPVGKNIVSVCVGTACHVAGASNIHESICEAMGVSEDIYRTEDTITGDDGLFTIEKVACVGCCTLAPVVQSERDTYGPLAKTDCIGVLKNVEERSNLPPAKDPSELNLLLPDGCPEIRIALDSCCIAQGADKVYTAMQEAIVFGNHAVRVKAVGCVGMSCNSPLVEIAFKGKEPFLYAQVAPHEAKKLVYKHFPPKNILKRIGAGFSKGVDNILDDSNWRPIETHVLRQRAETNAAFFGPQVRIATEFCGEIDPLDLAEYRSKGGFVAYEKALKELEPDEVIQIVKESGLRGRGGGGFTTGMKWEFVSKADGDLKYAIVNGDEGDPGAFMDRMLLESYPFRVLEGLAIASKATGVSEAKFYIRAEYPLAVKRVQKAIDICLEAGLIGENIMGTGFNLKMSIIKGAGAFICGEETAMINSIEGKRGVPNTRPPYPAVSGLFGKPTLINNVETFSNISWIIRNGAAEFAKYGTERSKGTKVFALAGKVKRGGMIEVPLGITINEIVHQIGGGCEEGRRFKAIQIGGPSGGCIPASLGSTAIDYEALKELGAIMGSGGMVVLDDTDCMVDIARYFMSFAKDESCGQCSIGRLGTTRLLEIMDKICAGKGRAKDLKELEDLGQVVVNGSLCGLCNTAPNPILTTLTYFREEYEAHLKGHCSAGKCKDLINYVIEDHCIGCTICSQYCPTDAIPLTPYRQHKIIDDLCIRCDLCYQVCPEDAIFIK
jgi:NADH-quinone oxidoreductase subunit F